MNDDLTRTARLARDRAYAPYSGFRMDAAVVTDDGTVVAADVDGDEEVSCTVGELLPKGPRKSKGR